MMNANPKSVILNTATPYYVLPKALMSAKQFVNKVTGEVVDITYGDKMVLMYLIDKVSFHNSEGRTMHESMPAIAEQLDMSAKSVQRSVKKLVEHHVVSATIVSAAKGYVYHSVDVDQQWSNGEVSVSNQERMKPNPINVQQAPVSVTKAVVCTPVAPSEAFAEPTPDDGMPDHLKAPEWDYSDVVSQMEASECEPRIGVMADDDVYGDDEFLQSVGY